MNTCARETVQGCEDGGKAMRPTGCTCPGGDHEHLRFRAWSPAGLGQTPTPLTSCRALDASLTSGSLSFHTREMGRRGLLFLGRWRVK